MLRGRHRRPYHHGALREALVAASEAVIGEHGVAGFSLREAARRAGVSHAAPAHHFGDARGLLTELAVEGYDRLAAAMTEELSRASADASRTTAIGLGYIRFAVANPALFRLMFHSDAVDRTNPRLCAAGDRAFALLLQASSAGASHDTPPRAPADADWPRIILSWSVVHGFATLAIEGPLMRGPVPMDNAKLMALAEAVLERLRGR